MIALKSNSQGFLAGSVVKESLTTRFVRILKDLMLYVYVAVDEHIMDDLYPIVACITCKHIFYIQWTGVTARAVAAGPCQAHVGHDYNIWNDEMWDVRKGQVYLTGGSNSELYIDNYADYYVWKIKKTGGDHPKCAVVK